MQVTFQSVTNRYDGNLMLYFAYGSNMDPRQMRQRCPSHKFAGIALLPDYHLNFPRRSARRRCGVAGVAPRPGSEVWGVVYDIPHPLDIARLDAAEGFHPDRQHGNSYRRESRLVYLGDGTISKRRPLRCLPARKPVTIEIYIPALQKIPPPPSRAYLGHMLRGGVHWGLPSDYLAELEQISPMPGRRS